MVIEDVESILEREPFVPLRLKKVDGKSLDIPFRSAAVIMTRHLLVFKGVKNERSCVATGYEAIGYAYIERIEPRRGSSGRRRKKAS